MILIAGGLGHIGTATVQALLGMGEDCLLVQRRSPELPDGRFSRAVRVERADVRDIEALRAIGQRHPITGIVHLAGSMPWPPDPDQPPVEAARRSLDGLFNVLQMAQEWGVARVGLASTIGVYSGLPTTGPLTEDLALSMHARHVIPTFKKLSELIGNHVASVTGVEIIHLRISGVWGPLGHLPNFAFPAPQYVYAAATGTPVDLSGVAGRLGAEDGLDLCYVHDIGRAIALLQTAEHLNHDTYNVASGRLTTNAEVVAAIRQTIPDFSYEFPESSPGPAAWLDITRLSQDTGYVPEWDTERAAADYIAWFRAGHRP